MKSSVFWALVRKDLYVLRGLMILTVVTGLAALFSMRFGRVGFAVGGILFLTVNIAGGIFMAMFSLLTERKEQSRLFALSLPISGFKHDLAKLLSGYLSFGIPWLILTAAGLLGFLLPSAAAERGMLVYGLVLQLFVLAMFSFVMLWLFMIKSEALAGVAILVSNISFSLFMISFNQPEVTRPLRTPQITWTPYTTWMLTGELIVIVGSLVAAFLYMSRQRDHI